MRTVYVKTIGPIYCVRSVSWAERLPTASQWLGVGGVDGKVVDVYRHPSGNFYLKG